MSSLPGTRSGGISVLRGAVAADRLVHARQVEHAPSEDHVEEREPRPKVDQATASTKRRERISVDDVSRRRADAEGGLVGVALPN